MHYLLKEQKIPFLELLYTKLANQSEIYQIKNSKVLHSEHDVHCTNTMVPNI